MTFTSTTAGADHPAQASGTDQAAAPTAASLSNHNTISHTRSSLGLLHDDNFGTHPVESKDITILRRLKLAILEGQHPYFKAKADLSNLQDLFLASGSRSMGPGAHQPGVLDPTLPRSSGHTRRNPPPALDDLGSSGPATLDYGNDDGNDASETSPVRDPQPDSTSAGQEDVNMSNLDDLEISEQPGGNSQDDSSENPGPDNQRPPTQTLGRYVLHSPIESRSDSEATHKRKASDTPTLVDSNDQSAEPEVNIKRESPPYQLSGSQPQPLEPSSSSMTSFASNSTTSTGLTSDDGGATETPPDTDTDLAGYNPKYGNKADYLRRQKVRSKAIESIDEKHRRTGHRQDSKPDQKSPARPMDHGSRRANDPNGSPVRGLDPPRTHTLTSISDSNEPGSSLRHTSPLDGLPPPSFQASPRGRPPASSFRPISPTSGKYPPPRRPRDPSPTRGYRSQYLPYDDDPRPARPRPIVSSPPRGSPPRESPAPRTAIDRQALDNYTSYPRTETRSFDLRPASPIFSEAPRAAGSYSMESNSNWPARAPPRAPPPPPSRNTPPTRDLIRDRTPFGSTAIPANPNAGYRPQGLPELSNTRYNPYDPPPRRVDWPARDWESANRPTDSKPKLQDRFNMDSTWPRDSLGSHSLDDYASRPLRDEFTSHLNDDYASRYRREPSPTASRYADGFRTGFTRPPEVEGIRPMKRSRPDDGYIPRSVPGVERSRYELDGRPPASDYYRREPPRRDDEYEPRSRPPY